MPKIDVNPLAWFPKFILGLLISGVVLVAGLIVLVVVLVRR